jgi:hypothetical protein
MNERSKGKPNFFQRQANEIVDGLIAIRQSREPFFGVQTVFAPLIDKLAKKRSAQKGGNPPSTLDTEKTSEYTVTQLF